MSVKEDARLCERCGQKWFATRTAKAPKPRWFDDTSTPWGSGSARSARLQANYNRSIASREKWSMCPNCGSIKVKTVSQAGFVPTGAISASAPQLPPASVAPKGGNPVWNAVKAFMKVHWRITLAVFCTIGAVSMPFGGENPGQRVGGGLGYLLAAILFWTLHIRHTKKMRAAGAPAPANGYSAVAPELDLEVEDGWALKLSDCQTKAAVFYEVATATNTEPVRVWLSAISDDIERQLATADDLATLGRSVEPGFTGDGEPTNPAAREAWSRLGTFEAGLDEAITGAAHVRLNSASPTADMGTIHTQLEMLKQQLPSLEAP